ncbi:MAG: hypothetical protein A2135_07330 [Actinobacteria bacterium RBG_16_67_15]|nr:MAG: hypothetical protein A2135_07330 [Actinobacteria bacterium RBG_16_67_15]
MHRLPISIGSPVSAPQSGLPGSGRIAHGGTVVVVDSSVVVVDGAVDDVEADVLDVLVEVDVLVKSAVVVPTAEPSSPSPQALARTKDAKIRQVRLIPVIL